MYGRKITVSAPEDSQYFNTVRSKFLLEILLPKNVKVPSNVFSQMIFITFLYNVDVSNYVNEFSNTIWAPIKKNLLVFTLNKKHVFHRLFVHDTIYLKKLSNN